MTNDAGQSSIFTDAAARKRTGMLSPSGRNCPKNGAVFHREASFLELKSFNQTVRIAFTDCIFCPQLDEWHQLVILYYLDLADGTKVSPQMINFGGLKDGLVRETKSLSMSLWSLANWTAAR